MSSRAIIFAMDAIRECLSIDLYERYKSILGNFNTNQRMTFEVTYMRRFIEYARAEDFIRSIAPSQSFDDNGQERASILWDRINEPRSSTTSARLTSFDAFDIEEFIAISSHVVHAKGSEPLPPNTMPNSAKPVKASYQNIRDVLLFCDHLRPEAGKAVVDDRIRKFTTLKLQGHIYRGAESRSNRGSYIQALWMGNTSDQPVTYPAKSCIPSNMRPSWQADQPDIPSHLFAGT
ncbi:hypothetical protein VTP01DRAFT_1954 [Rhizomucor pusillus]|uniref:uncharacterized protein n=1 Tax=Rhizomucor pusillus TaxID=4840 RepID=UPI00374210D6